MKQIKAQGARADAASLQDGEQGFMLLGLIVIIAIILIGLGVAASEVAFSLRREREAESARRADQYVRAIRRFYLKNQHYPGAIEQLENTNRVRYLRQRYVDPLTGKADYRLIPVGQNKTTVKGFFGQPLGGLATTGLGSVAGMQSPGIPGPGGISNQSGGGNQIGFTAGTNGTPGTAQNGTTGSPGQTSAPFTADPSGGQPGSGLPGAIGPFMGVGSSATGKSVLEINEQTTYESWEFLYDPRVEKLRQAAQLKSGMSSGSGFGQTPGGIGGGANLNGGGNLNGGSTPNSGGSPGGGAPPTRP
jgi:type II secretory pathway pseudopilin PulG